MRFLLAVSRAIDALSAAFGKIADWMVAAACLISAANAVIRYSLSSSSNAWLEAQWYLLAGMVMLGASYTLFRNEHVRVDLLYSSYRPRTRLYVDIFGMTFFLLPTTILLTWMTWSFFTNSWFSSEYSSNAGGLLRWPVKLILPVGFLLLTLQGFSEIIKRIALLRGLNPEAEVVTEYHRMEQ
jgi:TRAP-type mannitol/chloroaromatic compound transport system permease small subunit